MELKKDLVTAKFLEKEGKVQITRIMIEEFTPKEYLDNLLRMELAIEATEQNAKETRMMLKANEGDGVKELVEKYCKIHKTEEIKDSK